MGLRVACVHCRRPVALVHEIGLSALAVMATHLRQFHPDEQLGDNPSRIVILSHFSITRTDSDDEPPDTT